MEIILEANDLYCIVGFRVYAFYSLTFATSIVEHARCCVRTSVFPPIKLSAAYNIYLDQVYVASLPQTAQSLAGYA
jgi:hypothetical protein